MPVNSSEEGPRSGHLGTAWEIALVSVFVLVVFAVIAAVIFQIRRKNRRRRQEMLEAELEKGAAAPPELSSSRRASRNCEGESDASIPRPSPAASPSRQGRPSKTSSHADHRSHKPPSRYYWDTSKR